MNSTFSTGRAEEAQPGQAAAQPGFSPLAGKRVVDLSQVLAGPFATYQLALLGAEVLKIEKMKFQAFQKIQKH